MADDRRRLACLDCHFLMKESRDGKFLLTTRERQSIQERDYHWLHDTYSLACYFGVWDEGLSTSDKQDRNEVIVETNRKGFCFFWRYRPGMLFPAAEVLQQREAATREADRDRRFTVVGLWLAAIALIVDVMIQIVSLLIQ